MNILSINEWNQYITEMAASNRAAKEVDDFFDMLDPRKNSWAYVYYAKSMDDKLSKIMNHKRVANPMVGRCFMTIVYKFRFGRTYQEEKEKLNPGYQYNQNSTINQEDRKQRPQTLFPVEGYDLIRQNKYGNLVLPVLEPEIHKMNYYMIDDYGNLVECTRADIEPYMKPSEANPKPKQPKPAVPGALNLPQMKSLLVDKIYMLNADGKSWKNKYSFMFPILTSTFKK